MRPEEDLFRPEELDDPWKWHDTSESARQWPTDEDGDGDGDGAVPRHRASRMPREGDRSPADRYVEGMCRGACRPEEDDVIGVSFSDLTIMAVWVKMVDAAASRLWRRLTGWGRR